MQATERLLDVSLGDALGCSANLSILEELVQASLDFFGRLRLVKLDAVPRLAEATKRFLHKAGLPEDDHPPEFRTNGEFRESEESRDAIEQTALQLLRVARNLCALGSPVGLQFLSSDYPSLMVKLTNCCVIPASPLGMLTHSCQPLSFQTSQSASTRFACMSCQNISPSLCCCTRPGCLCCCSWKVALICLYVALLGLLTADGWCWIAAWRRRQAARDSLVPRLALQVLSNLAQTDPRVAEAVWARAFPFVLITVAVANKGMRPPPRRLSGREEGGVDRLALFLVCKRTPVHALV